MFEQLVDAFRFLDIFSKVVEAIGWFVFIIIIFAFIVALWQTFYLIEEASVSPFGKSKDKIGVGRVWVFFTLTLLLWPTWAIATAFIPTKEYIVMKAVAPKIDKYVETHPETLLSIENLTGEVDKAAKGVLDLLGSSSTLVKDYLKNQVNNTLDPKGELKAKEDK